MFLLQALPRTLKQHDQAIGFLASMARLDDYTHVLHASDLDKSLGPDFKAIYSNTSITYPLHLKREEDRQLASGVGPS